MADISQIQLPNNAKYNLNVPFVEGTGTTAGTWLGTLNGLTEYYDGLMILYKINIKGASTTTLNLNSLGAKTCYIYGTTKLTTHYPVNSIILLVYSANQNGGCWMCASNYYYTYFNMTASELIAGTATTGRTVRADYLKQGIEEIIIDKSVASQIKYANSESGLDSTDVQGAIDDIASELSPIGSVSSASWTASTSTAISTALTNYLSLAKGTYLVIVAYPVLANNDLFVSSIDGENISKWGGSYINMQSQQNTIRIVRANEDTQIRVLSAQSFSQSFSYLDRGGIFAIRIK